MSSRSSQQAMNFWPSPMVYLPFETPSNSSSSSSEMHCALLFQSAACFTVPIVAHPLREVHLHSEDTNVFGTRGGLDILVVVR